MSDPTAPFGSHDAFRERPDGDGYVVTRATFDATVIPGGERCHVICDLPSLDAAVVGETVPDVIRVGWFDTFERRLAEPGSALRTDDVGPVTVTRIDDRVLVEVTFGIEHPVEDAIAVVAFVEGTWFQGIVPGYQYIEPVAAAREAARSRGEGGPTSPS